MLISSDQVCGHTGDRVSWRFTQSLSKLLPENLNTRKPEYPKIAIALSGGSDSLALLHLARHAKLPIVALTIDHNLREASATEAKTVSQWMQTLGIEHHILRWNHPKTIPGNLQAEARKARYQHLTKYCQAHGIDTLLLGHTQDDQAETIAAMQERGSGPVGLAGMSAKRVENTITLLRPLLHHTRKELQDWLTAQSIPWMDEPSNTNTNFTRIRIRQELSDNPKRKEELLTLGNKMATLRQQIEAQHQAFIAKHISLHSDSLHLPAETLTQLNIDQAAYTLGRILCYVGGNDYPARYAKRLRLLEQLKQPTQTRYTLAQCLIERDDEQLIFQPEKDSSSFGTKPLVTSTFVPIFGA